MDVAKGSEFRHFDSQRGRLVIWMECPSDEKDTEARRFVVVGTGQEILDDSLVYRATCIVEGFVWHLYEDMGLKAEGDGDEG